MNTTYFRILFIEINNEPNIDFSEGDRLHVHDISILFLRVNINFEREREKKNRSRYKTQHLEKHKE